MSRCIIIAPLYAGEDAEWLRRGEGDFLICADGGYDAAVRCGMKPTSCPDQLAQALIAAKEQQKAQ